MMKPNYILINADEFKTKGVIVYIKNDDTKLYIDKECTVGVTKDQLEKFFYLGCFITGVTEDTSKLLLRPAALRNMGDYNMVLINPESDGGSVFYSCEYTGD